MPIKRRRKRKKNTREYIFIPNVFSQERKNCTDEKIGMCVCVSELTR